MAIEIIEEWHRPTGTSTTLRLPVKYVGVAEWAESIDMTDALEVICIILGCYPDPRSIKNLTSELINPISKEESCGWAEHPVAARLWQFSRALESTSPPINGVETYLGHSGTAAKTKSDIRKYDHTKNAYLLTMVSVPIPRADSHDIQLERHRLRMWLVVQAAIHLTEKQCSSDKNINKLARELAIGSESVEKWRSIDALLFRAKRLRGKLPATFKQFTNSLCKAAIQIMPSPGENRSLAAFLNVLIAIAEGRCEKAAAQTEGSPNYAASSYARFQAREPQVWSIGDLPSFTHLPPSLNDDDESDSDNILLLTVDSEDSEEEQALTSRAFHLHRAEESHYLPWSWDKVLPPELDQLEAWVSHGLKSVEKRQSLVAAYTWLATKLGRSLFQISSIAIGAEPGDEWVLSTDYRSISRTSPRRTNSWRPKTPEEIAEIAPFVDSMTFDLPADISSVISLVSKSSPSSPTYLGQLWKAFSPDVDISRWFDAEARIHFPRLTSGKLDQVGGQHVFDQSGDYNLARVATSPPNSGLPGACGYASWDIDTISKGLSLSVAKSSSDNLYARAMGSVLAPLESFLQERIDETGRAIKTSTSDDLITFHNKYTSYCVKALYAATGCRHLKSPFETIGAFNVEHRCVYINDKSEGGLHDGRIVPLPTKLATLLACYITYLKSLKETVSTLRPTLATKISGCLSGGAKDIPLFFLLDEALSWHQMTNADLPGLPVLYSLLPFNLFRHRYVQRLIAEGVPVDIVDGWMGHAERAVATYGDFSPRCWIDDAVRHQARIDRMFDSLGFECIAAPAVLPRYKPPVDSSRSTSEPITFGVRERQNLRRKTHAREIKYAKLEIVEFIGGRELDSLSDDDIASLCDQMLRKENGFHHSYAAIRFRQLTKFLASSGGKHKRSIKKRLANIDTEKSLVSPALPRALDTLAKLNKWCRTTQAQVQKAQISKSEALCVGAALLCIEKRLSYKRLLLDVIQGVNFRQVQHKKSYYVEYAEEWNPDDFTAPVQRHEISYKTASLLAHGRALKSTSYNEESRCPRSLESLRAILAGDNFCGESANIKALFDGLTKVVEQSNLVLMPGMVAGALSSRMPPTSLNWQDYLRITEKKNVLTPGMQLDSEQVYEIGALRLNQGVIPESEKTPLQDNAKQYFDDISHLINAYAQTSSINTAKAIEVVCKRYSGKVSSSILLVGYWLSSVIKRGKGRGKRHAPYVRGSILRYFSALRGPFQGLAYNVDLMTMDGEDITDLYAEMFEALYEKQQRTDYFSERLKSFQRWAERNGVDRPDWAELDSNDAVRSVSSGCLSEQDYFACQDRIVEQWGEHSKEAMFLGFVLLLTFRFGLRAKEALGLRRIDWCEYNGTTWVLIRNNKIRRLKTPSSRRVVPLLFPLNEFEKILINNVLNHYEIVSGSEINNAILCEIRNGTIRVDASTENIPKAIIATLREITGNPRLVLHHCRHSFYNVIAPILLGFGTPSAKALCGDLDVAAIRQIILGPNNDISRRSGMAIARLMGHHRPQAGLKNYNHLMTEWADSLTPITKPRARIINEIYNTKRFEEISIAIKNEIKEPIGFPEPTLLQALQLLRLVSLGKTFEQAGKMTKTNPDFNDMLKDVFASANDKMRFKTRGEQDKWLTGNEYSNALLHYVSDAAWLRVLEKGECIETNFTIKMEGEIPSLQELLLMIGDNRHVLMSHDPHCNLVKLALDMFDVSNESYHVFSSDDHPRAHDILTRAGFNVRSVFDDNRTRKPAQLDSFRIDPSGTLDRRVRYGALIMQKNAEGVVRTSFELVVVMLVIGVLLNLNIEAVNLSNLG